MKKIIGFSSILKRIKNPKLIFFLLLTNIFCLYMVVPSWSQDTTPPTSVELYGNVVDMHQIVLAWSPSHDSESGINHYEIYDASNNGYIASTASTTYPHTGLSTYNTYRYYVIAVDNEENRSSKSNELKTTVLPCFNRPLFVDFEPNNNFTEAIVGFPRNYVPSYHFYGNIDDETDQDWYKVYAYVGQTIELSIQAESTGTELGWEGRKPSGTTILFTDPGLLGPMQSYTVQPGEAGFYIMRVWNNNNNGDKTRYDFDVKVTPQADTICPSPVSNLTKRVKSATEVDFTWNGSSDNEGYVGYGICIIDADPDPNVAEFHDNDFVGFTYNQTSFKAKYLKPDTTYIFGVAAADKSGNFSAGTAVTVTTPKQVLYGNLITSDPSGQIMLSWDMESKQYRNKINYYEIYNADTDESIAQTSDTFYQHDNLSEFTTYKYYVKAFDEENSALLTSANNLQTTVLPCFTNPMFFDLEPNDTLSEATVGFPRNLVPSYQVYGYIDDETDEDWYQVYAYVGQTIELSIQAESTGTELGWEGRKPSGTILFTEPGLLGPMQSYTVQPGEEGLYSMRVWNNNNNGDKTRYDFDVKVTPQIDTLSPENVTNLTATAISTSGATLSWDASDDDIGPVGYGICNLSTNHMKVTTTETTIRFNNLSPNTPYNFAVAASDSGGNFSNAATVFFRTPAIVVTHTITASAGENGSISPSGTISGVVHNTTQSFTVSPDSGYQAVMSGTCGGNLVGTTYTTNPITADCTVIASFNPTGSSQELPTGNNVEVSVPVSGGTVMIEFDQIVTGGTLTVTATDTPLGGGPPTGFKFLGTYYDVTFTGSFSGYIYITFPYKGSSIPSGKEKTLKLFHWKNNGWEDCTFLLDKENNEITGRVTSLSPFGFGYSSSSSSGSGSSGGGYSTGANENMIALIAILAILSGIYILRRKRKIN